MTREEIDAAIKRHADFELLYDKPYEDKKKVRVTGPFTVESLARTARSPSLAAPEPGVASARPRRPRKPTRRTSSSRSLTTSPTAGIQNGRKQRADQVRGVRDLRRCSTSRRWASATASRTATPRARIGDRDRAAVRHRQRTFVKNAAREALKAEDIDLLAILASPSTRRSPGRETTVSRRRTDEGFANVAGERKLGRIPVLMVRMNADLLMGEELKKTGAGNLFTVFGEPDIEIGDDEDEVARRRAQGRRCLRPEDRRDAQQRAPTRSRSG